MADTKPKHSYQVGYRGLAKINGQIMLCTGGSVSVSQDPIMSGGVWGAGESNISPIAYAWNYLTLDGAMNVELTTASGYWGNFTGGSTFILYPEGSGGFSGSGYRTTTSVEASEGSALTGSVNFKGTGGNLSSGTSWSLSPNSSGSDATIVNYGYGYSDTAHGASAFAGSTLIPYWRTTVITGCSSVGTSNYTLMQTSENNGNTCGSIGDVISWSVSRNRDVQFLKCCNLNSASPLVADYVVMGEITGDCSYTTFGLSSLTAKSFHRQHKNLTFLLNIGGENRTESTSPYYGRNYNIVYVYAQVPIAIRNSGSTSMATGGSYISTEFSYTALGDTLKCGVNFGSGSGDASSN